jgi:hypothetical protein
MNYAKYLFTGHAVVKLIVALRQKQQGRGFDLLGFFIH